jgi:hypothetical protein
MPPALRKVARALIFTARVHFIAKKALQPDAPQRNGLIG